MKKVKTIIGMCDIVKDEHDFKEIGFLPEGGVRALICKKCGARVWI